MSGFLPPTMAELDSESTRLDAQRTQIQIAVNECPQLDPITRTQWESYNDSFDFTRGQIDRLRAVAGPMTVFVQADLGRELDRHAADLNAWQVRLAHLCGHLDIPAVPDKPKTGVGLDLDVSASTKVLIGGGIALVLLLALRR